MLHAGTVIKVGYRDALDRGAAVALACRSLWEAADADSATGGPDALRGIYPVVATITADGWSRLPDDELAATFAAIAEEVRAR
jgi:proteasome beta subunit